MSDIQVSVVIGFKDWGIGRLVESAKSIQAAFGSLRGEIIVSDYGSADGGAQREELTRLGVKYVYTETDGIWSRSRALNAGFAVSSGRVLISTDADMVFSPGSLEIVAGSILDDPNTACLLQCRDLPSEWSDVEIAAKGADWAEFERVARRRERWGMGGMAAVHRATYLRIRGYDERMQLYGGEDIDFASRVRRAGCRIHWVEDPGVRMYHMWHPSTAAKHALSAEESAQIDFNKRIMREDKTFIRNVTSWRHRPADADPLVSVVIATYERANLIEDSINSVLAQTVQDFEIVVIDDGSTDDTEERVRSFGDSRIRYIRQENAGVAAARNRGTDEARGQYIVVLDDDDISPPWRLEAQFEVLHPGVGATFGSSMNFDDSSGETKLYAGKVFTEETVADSGGAPAHSTWMVDRTLMSELRYDETLDSGIDNDFALRSLRAGVVWAHTGTLHSLRRMHATQITGTLSKNQANAARRAYDRMTFPVASWTLEKLRKERGSHDYVPLRNTDENSVLAFLPDHLVSRTLLSPRDGDQGPFVVEVSGEAPMSFEVVIDPKWGDLGRLGGASLEGLSAVRRAEGDDATSEDAVEDEMSLMVGLGRERAREVAQAPSAILVEQVLLRAQVPEEERDVLADPDARVVVVRNVAEDQIWRGVAVKRAAAAARWIEDWSKHGSVTVDGSPAEVRSIVGAFIQHERAVAE